MTDERLSGKRVLLVVPATQFRDEEVFEPRQALEAAGAQVTVASSTKRTCHGMNGGAIDAEIALDEASAEEYDAIVLAGGSSVPGLFWKDKKLAALVTAASQAGKIIGAMSLSTVVLARAQLLKDKRATVYYLPEAIEELRSAGATYVPDKVVREGNLVMAEGPADTLPFAEALIGAITGSDPTQTASARP